MSGTARLAVLMSNIRDSASGWITSEAADR